MKTVVCKAVALATTVALTVATAGIENLYQINSWGAKETTESVPNTKEEDSEQRVSKTEGSNAEDLEAKQKETQILEKDSVGAKNEEVIEENTSNNSEEETQGGTTEDGMTETTSSVPEAVIVVDENSIELQKDGMIYGKKSLEISAGIYKKDSNELEPEAIAGIQQKEISGWSGQEDLAATIYQWDGQKVVLENYIPEDAQAMVKENYQLSANYQDTLLDKKEITVVWDHLAPEISLNYTQEQLTELEKVHFAEKVVFNYQAKDKEVQTESNELISGAGVEKVVAEFESRIQGGYAPEKVETTSLNTIEINIEKGKEFHGVCRLYAVDYLGNVSEPKEISLNIDNVEPKITILGGKTTGWQEELTITARVEDYCLSKGQGEEADFWLVFEQNGVVDRESIVYTKNLQESTEDKEVYYLTIQAKKERYKDYSGNCTIYASDKAGNIVTYQTEDNQFLVNFDSTKPVFTDVTITDENKNLLENICNQLSFGMFFKDKIKLEVQAEEILVQGAASGIRFMEMYVDGKKYTPVSVTGDGVETYVVTFLLDVEDRSENIIFVMEDNAGNKNEQSLSEINQSYNTSGIYIDKASPYVVITPVESDLVKYQDKEKHNWYNKEVSFEIKAGDNLSGFAAIEVEVNGKKLSKDEGGMVIQEENFQKQCVTEKTFYISTSQGTSKKDTTGKETGRYDISISITDHSGNVTTKTKTVYVDVTEPYIKGVEVKGEGNIEGNGTLTSSKQYEYFIQGNARLVVTAADDKGSSGVKSITYYTVNYANNSQGEISKEKTVSVDKNNQITIKLNSGFKGAVYLKATDNTKHSTSKYERPHLIATGTNNRHMRNSAVTITLPKETVRDENNDPLYGESVTADIRISDKDMGLAAVEWSVTSDYDKTNQISGSLQIDKKGKVTDNTIFTVAAKDKNLVTEMTGKIPVNNDSNHIKVWVKITDRAGMTTEREIFLSIDKQKPVIEVTYDNNNFASEYAGETEYYKDNRTATIVVKERNFDEKNVQVKVSNAEGEVPSVTAWEKADNTASPDNTTHTARVVFATDGDYTLEITAADKIGNQANDYSQDKFVIDKTKPVIEITFDKSNRETGNYYSEGRTATITIKEHNFESSHVQITGSNANGENNTFPELGSFKTEGDTHQAALEFSTDGLYSFTAAYTDKAGNEAEVVQSEDFYIDTTEPEIIFEGVQQHGAYREEAAPVISCKDENMDTSSLKAQLRIVNLNEGKVIDAVQQGEVTTTQDSCRLQMASPEHTKEQDGIYYLDVEIKDLAGNLHKETLEYSVNRFGSVYTLEDEAKKASGNYVKSTGDIEILETNADEIHQAQVKLTKNGEITELKEAEDYVIKESTEAGAWKQYHYVIKKENFQEDGVYMITLSSKDKAGNTNENTAEEKEAELWFGVDTTSPVIVPLNVEEGESYNVTELEAQIEVQDNLKLDSVKGYVNDLEVEMKENQEQGFYTLSLTESTKEQKLRIVATDAAGNELVREVGDIYITTNPWVRLLHNKMAVTMMAGGVIIVLAFVGVLLVLRKKKRAK